jgi:exonuclease SbcD
MKILHTSDWHIGKHLHKIDLSEDLQLFFDWLILKIDNEKIDVLLVSGDIFDQSNPSQAAQKLYYDFLKRMIPFNCEIVITGGNHDSVAMLNAPKQLLEVLNVRVVGGATEHISELFFRFKDEDLDVVVAAVPFLRDRDIRKAAPGETYSDKIEQLRDGLKSYFEKVNEHYLENHKGAKFIIMGHLYVQGADLSESEREIQIGNQAGVEHEIFGSEADYVALGHIHKPYAVSTKSNIHYSGSPISFSFSEKEDIKQVNIIEITSNQLDVNIVQVPKFRRLVSFQGTFDEVSRDISNFTNECELEALGEIEINEETENVGVTENVEDIIQHHGIEGLNIVKRKLIFKDRLMGGSGIFDGGIDVADFTTTEMFEKRLEFETSYDDDFKDELRNAFKELLGNLGGKI